MFVIDAKNYRGCVEERSEGGWRRPRIQKLVVGGRDRTNLVGGMHFQLQKVRESLDAAPGKTVPVTGMLCFVDSDWPLIGGALLIDDVHVLWPKKIKDYVVHPPTLDQAAIDHWHRALAGAFTAA